MPAISSKALLCSKLHWDHKEKQGNSIVAGRGRWMTFGFPKNGRSKRFRAPLSRAVVLSRSRVRTHRCPKTGIFNW